MKIENSTTEDIPEIFRLYRLASEFQKKAFPGNVWPEFEDALVRNEVTENRQFKLMIDDQIACVWAIGFSDIKIWPGTENDRAVYIHRIATNPDFRGNNFVKLIVDWAKEYANQKNLDFIRMDTCGDNRRLINHYENCGFNFLGMERIEDSTGLPAHYDDADVCYFEIAL